MKIKEIFKIVEGATVWNLTSGDAPEVFAGDTYLPVAMGRTEFESKNELSKSNIEVSFSVDNVMARRWMTVSLDTNVTITVWTKQDETYFVAWKGRLSSVKPSDQTIKLVFESVFTSLRRPGLRRRYQRNCGHVLYGRGCRLDKAAFAVASNVTVRTSNTVITVPAAAAKPDGWYTGGMIQTGDGTLRFITAHTGDQITLIRPMEQISIPPLPIAVNIYPGCDRTMDVCINKFNNLLNNGSFRYIPVRNPFTGNSFA
jgi:uncharacterized phage protein (TIGR02218 family)